MNADPTISCWFSLHYGSSQRGLVALLLYSAKHFSYKADDDWHHLKFLSACPFNVASRILSTKSLCHTGSWLFLTGFCATRAFSFYSGPGLSTDTCSCPVQVGAIQHFSINQDVNVLSFLSQHSMWWTEFGLPFFHECKASLSFCHTFSDQTL